MRGVASRSTTKSISVPVVDLFAGPGGLSEGFHALSGPVKFDVALSVEKDGAAHQTLELRSFVRQFARDRFPQLYYDFLRGEATSTDYLYAQFPREAARARAIAWKAELGVVPNAQVYERIASAIGGARHWVLLGGPPCQAYSVIGRSRMAKMDSFANDRRHTLYREYLKIVASLQPSVFVMENVKGILSSQHNESGIFSTILRDLRDPWEALPKRDRKDLPEPAKRRQYRIYSFSTPCGESDQELRPTDYVIASERYAIPQRRHRVILFGIRSDFEIVPPILEPAGHTVRLRDVLYGMPRLRSKLSDVNDDLDSWRAALRQGRSACISECSGRHRGMGKIVKKALQKLPKQISCGGAYVKGGAKPIRLTDWLYDVRLGGAIQHESRSHMASDLHRYLFCACYAKWAGRSPSLESFPLDLLPNHVNVHSNTSGKVLDFADRFRVQLENLPATTVTSHISKDGHYFIHPDPTQCRSLTVREAARLQTFPDNYYFAGNRTQQYHQVGNAVPPFLAFQLAVIVADAMNEIASQEKMGNSRVRRISPGKPRNV